MYVNRLDLLGGALRTSLRAEAAPSRADRLDLVFGDVQFQLGPLKLTQASFNTEALLASVCWCRNVVCVRPPLRTMREEASCAPSATSTLRSPWAGTARRVSQVGAALTGLIGV